ncbi:hypothetical protein [Methylotetracoccus oryzae]|uniref:hypothetical protein n=1 Tax=Methylotetracoccus oryzae TaxID=1919059 RepID=UPI0011188352|nr:hypothetical protein [Methylotetracoccus oryzae]
MNNGVSPLSAASIRFIARSVSLTIGLVMPSWADEWLDWTKINVKERMRDVCSDYEKSMSDGLFTSVKDYMSVCDNPIIDGTCRLALEGFCVEGQGYEFPLQWKPTVKYTQTIRESGLDSDRNLVNPTHKFGFTPIIIYPEDVFNKNLAAKFGIPADKIYQDVFLDDAKRRWRFCNKGTPGNKHFAQSGPGGLQPGDQVDLYSAPIFDAQPLLALRTHIFGDKDNLNYNIEVVDNLSTYDYPGAPVDYQRGEYKPRAIQVRAYDWDEALTKLAYNGLKCMKRRDFEKHGENFSGYYQYDNSEARVDELREKKVKRLREAFTAENPKSGPTAGPVK